MRLSTIGRTGQAAIAALLASAAAATAQPQAQLPQAQLPAAPMPTRPMPRAPIPVAALLPETQGVLDAAVRAGKVPGAVVSVGVGDGPTLFLAAGRIADGAAAPAGADSLWRVYSMTKPITAMAAMILIGEGKLKLDEPLAAYLPAFAHMRVLTDPDHSLASRPAARPITIRNLLTHTAGLGYTIVTRGPLLHAYEQAGITPFTSDVKTDAQLRARRPATLAAFADAVAAQPLIADPGSRWSYSIGLDVMAAVIEKVGAMPFDRFVQARIFAPLGMRSSYWTVPVGEAGRLSTNYVATNYVAANYVTPNYVTGMGSRLPLDPGATSVWLAPPSFAYGGAGLVMSARDYDIFLHCLADGGSLNGVRVLRPETAALMTSNLLPPGVAFGGSGSANGTGAAAAGTTGGPTGFGAGGSVYVEDGPGGYPGKGTYGWGGAAGTTAFIDPRRHTRVTVMLNLMGGVPGLREQLVAAMVRDGRRLRGE